jgi:hypothetical protein
MARPFKCPYCGEEGRTVCKGFRRTKTMGKRRIRLCKACGRKFTPKKQKWDEEPRHEEEPQGGPSDEPSVTGGAASQTEQPKEASEAPSDEEGPQENEDPADSGSALAQMFPPPDDQWTS